MAVIAARLKITQPFFALPPAPPLFFAFRSIYSLPQNALEGLTHAQTIDILKATKGTVRLKVKRRCRRVSLLSQNGKYGLGLRGGRDVNNPVVVTRIATDSPASYAPEIEVRRKTEGGKVVWRRWMCA